MSSTPKAKKEHASMLMTGLPIKHLNEHRPFNLTDEQGWDRYISLPLTGKEAVDAVDHGQGGWEKYGLVLDKASSGKWDEKHVNRPCVIRVGDECFMYYCGRNNANVWQIGLATRSGLNPIGVFTRYGTDGLIIPRNTEGTYDAESARGFSVIYDREEGKFIGWYEGRTYTPTRHIIRCESADGKTWSNFTKVYDLDIDDQQPWVLRVGSLYYCIYMDGTLKNIHLLTSNNGINWTDYGQIIDVGGAGAWDENQVNYCSVFWNMGVWYAIYQGQDAGGDRRVGIATSPNGFNYTKHPFNPILALGEVGDHDQTRVTAPTGFLVVEDKYYLWYNGFDGLNYRILLAYMPV